MKIVASPAPASTNVPDAAAVRALQAEIERLREELASVRVQLDRRLAETTAAALIVPVPTPQPEHEPASPAVPKAAPAAAPVLRERATDPFFAQLWAYVSRPSA